MQQCEGPRLWAVQALAVLPCRMPSPCSPFTPRVPWTSRRDVRFCRAVPALSSCYLLTNSELLLSTCLHPAPPLPGHGHGCGSRAPGPAGRIAPGSGEHFAQDRSLSLSLPAPNSRCDPVVIQEYGSPAPGLGGAELRCHTPQSPPQDLVGPLHRNLCSLLKLSFLNQC